MQKMNIILETTFSTVTPGDGTVAHKHVLHREANGCITYNRVQSDETGWETTCFHEDLEKGIKFFLKQVAADRKSFLGNKSMKIILAGIRFQTFPLATKPFLTDEVGFDPLGWWFSESAALRSRKHDKRALYDKFTDLQKTVGCIAGFLGYDYIFGDQRDPKKLKPSKIRAIKKTHPRLCQDQADIGKYLSDAYDDAIAGMSTSQRAIITLLQQGGSWAWRMYEAMPDVIDPLLKRIIQQES